MNATALTFHETTFHPVIREGQLWLTSVEIAKALGYVRLDDVSRLYRKNAREFTPSMTAVVENADSAFSGKSKGYGNLKRKVRIFSLRGAHLIGMFARTDLAAEFRRWVLDILDRHIEQLPHNAEDTLTPSEQHTLSALVHQRAEAYGELQGKVLAQIWSRVHRKFRIAQYRQLPRAQLTDALLYVTGMEIRLGKADALPAAKRYHYPRRLLEQPHFTTAKLSAALGVSMLGDTTEFVSPLFALLNELRADGHEISAPWDEAVAMREAIQRADKAMEESIQLLWASRFGRASSAGDN